MDPSSPDYNTGVYYQFGSVVRITATQPLFQQQITDDADTDDSASRIKRCVSVLGGCICE